MVGSDSKVSYMELYRFSEEIAYDLFRKKSLSSRLKQHGEEKLVELLMDLCFEVMYPRLINLDENHNIMLQEKLFILQNIVTPKMLNIKDEHFAYNVYQLSFEELKKINALKSPRHKCQAIFESINCLSSLFNDVMPSADDLFPIMVYCIMSSNPPNLVSNLDFISDYLSPEQKLNREGFVLTNLMAAISFLKNIDSKALLKGELKLKQEKRDPAKGKWAQKMQEREAQIKREEMDNMQPIELDDDSSDSEGGRVQPKLVEQKTST